MKCFTKCKAFDRYHNEHSGHRSEWILGEGSCGASVRSSNTSGALLCATEKQPVSSEPTATGISQLQVGVFGGESHVADRLSPCFAGNHNRFPCSGSNARRCSVDFSQHGRGLQSADRSHAGIGAEAGGPGKLSGRLRANQWEARGAERRNPTRALCPEARCVFSSQTVAGVIISETPARKRL